MKKRVWWLILFAAIYLNNSSFFVRPKGKPLLFAHRGLAQTFPMEGITGQTNTARIIYEPEHPYLENTILSMEAAFSRGADLVELDLQLTRDGEFAVFHDWLLDYRTEKQGALRDYTMAELKKVDVGYGYTADQGKTYPFRGKGVGLMPTLPEVLAHFPKEHLVLHLKSDEQKDGEKLGEYLSLLSDENLGRLVVYGGDRSIAALHERLPQLRVMSKATMIEGLLAYMAIGWTGYVPGSLRNTQLHLPEKYAPWLWGWPTRFLRRMEGANTRVILVAGEGGFSEGFDTVEDLMRLPQGYTGGIWTNRIDRIASVFSR
jgi:glycerophosphoryl diester phosphodiesterase